MSEKPRGEPTGGGFQIANSKHLSLTSLFPANTQRHTQRHMQSQTLMAPKMPRASYTARTRRTFPNTQ